MSKHVQRDQDARDAAKTEEFHQKLKANPAALVQVEYKNWKSAALISAACNSFLYGQCLGGSAAWSRSG
jgi:hypothetical protein